MGAMEANLVSVEKVPEEYRSVFNEFPYFNNIQSSVFDHVLNSDKPFVIAAPTGSGKTVIFELAIIRLLKQLDSFATPILSSTKIIYVAPMKALCEERYVDWYKKFNKFGLKCVAITGDSNQTFMDMLEYNIIITTPEKWDTLTRKWRDYKKLVSSIKLFLIDEIHLINEEKRGATLETIVCRMKTIESFQYEDSSSLLINGIRFVAVSATIPNIEDVAQWIGSANNAAINYSFSEDMRPVKLKKIVHGYQAHDKNPFKFDILLNYKLQPIVLQYAEGKPTLIFCSTRKSVEMTTKYISQNITVCMTMDQKSVLSNAAKIIEDNKCREFLVHGVGYHHAGMLLENRRIIENLFRNGDLPILVTTSTLALGVNLPAHLVIIKSTKYFTNGQYSDYSEGTVLQMIGRAGRPQFDTSATAVILTTTKDKVKYESMLGRGQVIESNLHRHLIEHLNADICLKTVTDLGIALQWISSTFLYIRAKKSPRYYGLPANLTDKELDGKLLEMCQIDINRLVSAGMITMDQMASISSTRLGHLMAEHYIAFDTMQVFINIRGDEVLSQMLMTLSACQEFQELYIRSSDKKTLNLLNKNKTSECIRFPFNSRITTADMKVNCLIQAVFGCLQIIDHSLLNDASKIIRAGQRVTSCLTKYLEMRNSNCFMALLNSYILTKCFQAKIWENSKFVSRQLSDIGTVRSKLLVDADKITFQSILDSNPRDLERIMKRKAPFGDNIREQIISFPCYKMTLTKKPEEYVVELKITVTNVDEMQKSLELNDMMILIVGDDENNILLHEKYTHDYMKDNITIERDIQYYEDSIHINANFICENKVGLDCVEIFEINPNHVQKENLNSQNVNTVKKSSSRPVKKVTVQKTMNNFFPVVKTKRQNNAKKSASFDKENIPDNTVDSIIVENQVESNTKTIEDSTLQISETIKMTEDLSKIKSKRITNHADFFSDINKIILQNGNYGEGKKSEENILLSHQYISKPSTSTANTSKLSSSKPSTSKLNLSRPSTSKISPSKPSTSLPQIDALDVIKMLNKKFNEKVKSKAKLQVPKSKPSTATSSIKEFLSKYEASKQILSSKRLTPIENFEHSLYKEIDDEVPKKKALTNDGISVRVPDSTVCNNEFQYEVVVIEPEVNTERNGNSRNIKWRSPLIISPKEKHSPYQRSLFNFSQYTKKSHSPAVNSQVSINTRNAQFRLRNDKTIPISPIANKEADESEIISTQNSFISPNLISLLCQESQKNTDNLNTTSDSSTTLYEQNYISDYYNSLKERSSPVKETESQQSVTKDTTVRTNYEELLEIDNDEFLQAVLLHSIPDNVKQVDQLPEETSTDNDQYFDSRMTPRRSSSSIKLSNKSLDFGEDESKFGEVLEQADTEVNMQYEAPRNEDFEGFKNYRDTLDNYQLPQANFDFPSEPMNSPPRIQFDELTRDYYEPHQTSRYFDRPHTSQRSSHSDMFHNPQPFRNISNRINIPSQFEQSSYFNHPPQVPLLNENFPAISNQYYYQEPLRYQDDFRQPNNEFRMPYPRHSYMSQIMYHPVAQNNPRFATQTNNNYHPNWQRQVMIGNEQRYRNIYPNSQPLNTSHSFGSLEQQTLHNQRVASNSVGTFHQSQRVASNSVGTFNQSQRVASNSIGTFNQSQRVAANSVGMFNSSPGRINELQGRMRMQFRMPEVNDMEHSFSRYEGPDEQSFFENGKLNPIRRVGNENANNSAITEDPNYRRMSQGSQLMDTLNPPEERDGKRIIFSRFMNSLDQ